ncbi:hypothetical protein V7S76_03430 [Aquirufa sp. ROCK2-A2]
MSQKLLAQKLSGIIQDPKGKGISNVSILVKKSAQDADFTAFYFSQSDGSFSFELEEIKDKVFYIEFRALNFQTKLDSFFIQHPRKDTLFRVVLEESTTLLNEVVIVENRRLTQIGDTTTFHVKSFRDGSERNVEDVLKKLPGIEVNEDDGSLKYLGKKVEEVQLDGDDLFGFKYAVGTRNISADMIEKVEAIDHFFSNPLMKGFAESKTTALNLKLKKGHLDLSKNITAGIGGGENPSLDLALDLIAVSQKSKSYLNTSYNNVGLNASPFNFFSDQTIQLNDLFFEDFKPSAPKIINSLTSNSMFSDRRTTINNQKNLNLNTLLRINSQWSIRANVFLLNDQLFSNELTKTNFAIPNDKIMFNDEITSNKDISMRQVEVKLKFKDDVKRQLIVESSLFSNELYHPVSYTRNNGQPNQTLLKSSEQIWNNVIDFSRKYKKNVFQYIGHFAMTWTPQEFLPIQNMSYSDKIDVFSNYQTLAYQKSSLLNKWILYRKFRNINFQISAGFSHQNLNFNSALLENAYTTSEYVNQNHLRKSQFFQHVNVAFDKNKWHVESDISLNQMNQRFDDEWNKVQQQKFTNYVNVNFEISHQLRTYTKLFLNGKMDQTAAPEKYFFLQKVVNQNRGTVENQINLDMIENQQFSVGLRDENLNTGINQHLILSRVASKNIYVSEININENISQMMFFQVPRMNYFTNFSYSIDKYIFPWKLNLSHTSNLLLGNSFNKLSSTDLNEYFQYSYQSVFDIRTMSGKMMDVENKISLMLMEYKGDFFQNQNTSFNNAFKCKFNLSKKYASWILWEYYKPDIMSHLNFSFVDVKVERKFGPNKNIRLALTGKNILNTKYFNQINNTNYSSQMIRSSLLPGYWMLSGNYNF